MHFQCRLPYIRHLSYDNGSYIIENIYGFQTKYIRFNTARSFSQNEQTYGSLLSNLNSNFNTIKIKVIGKNCKKYYAFILDSTSDISHSQQVLSCLRTTPCKILIKFILY